MPTAIDTNVLVEILGAGPQSSAAIAALAECGQQNRLVVSAVVYSELLVGAPDLTGLDQVLGGMGIDVDWQVGQAVWAEAARAWREHLHRRKRQGPYPCPGCGHNNDLRCAGCGKPLVGPRRMLNDFLIGAHAVVAANGLITWDRGIYGTYFPALRIYSPKDALPGPTRPMYGS